MAAGLGFKDFTTGEVLTAADVDGYLMQGVWVFASAAARDAAVTSPQEGNFAYLKDTNVTTYYTGSAWANLDTTGMTNPMTTTGDTIYSSSGSTPARLGIGTAGQVLTVNSGATAPEWAAPAGGSGLTFINKTSFTTSSGFDLDNIFTSSYENYLIRIQSIGSSGGATCNIFGRYGGSTETGSNYNYAFAGTIVSADTINYQRAQNTTAWKLGGVGTGTGQYTCIDLNIYRENGSAYLFATGTIHSRVNMIGYGGSAQIETLRTYDGIRVEPSAGTLTGQITVYGLAKA